MKNIMQKTLPLLFLILLFACSNDDDNANQNTDNFTQLIGLWDYDNASAAGYDAIFLDADSTYYNIRYGNLGQTSLFIGSGGSKFTYNANQIQASPLGSEAVPYEGGNSIMVPGNTLNKVAEVSSIDDFVGIIDPNLGTQVNIYDFTFVESPTIIRNMDWFDNRLYVPNADNNSYLLFNANTLEYMNEIGTEGSAYSISVVELNPNLLDVLEDNLFRIYQQFPFNILESRDYTFSVNRFRTHTHPIPGRLDLIAYDQLNHEFEYLDINDMHGFIAENAIVDWPVSEVVTGLEYVAGAEVLLVASNYNLFLFDVVIENGSSVSSITHRSSHTLISSLVDGRRGQIRGVTYDPNQEQLFLMVSFSNESAQLIKQNFQL